MPWFECVLNGENFPGSLVNKSGLVGFFLTRFVESTDFAAAEESALEILSNEPILTMPEDLELDILPRVVVESVEQVTAESVPPTPPAFSWYLMPQDAE